MCEAQTIFALNIDLFSILMNTSFKSFINKSIPFRKGVLNGTASKSYSQIPHS